MSRFLGGSRNFADTTYQETISRNQDAVGYWAEVFLFALRLLVEKLCEWGNVGWSFFLEMYIILTFG